MTLHALLEQMCTDCRCVVKVEVRFFDALAMVSFGVGKPKQPFFHKVTVFNSACMTLRFQRRVTVLFFVPERKSNILEAVRV